MQYISVNCYEVGVESTCRSCIMGHPMNPCWVESCIIVRGGLRDRELLLQPCYLCTTGSTTKILCLHPESNCEQARSLGVKWLNVLVLRKQDGAARPSGLWMCGGLRHHFDAPQPVTCSLHRYSCWFGHCNACGSSFISGVTAVTPRKKYRKRAPLSMAGAITVKD